MFDPQSPQYVIDPEIRAVALKRQFAPQQILQAFRVSINIPLRVNGESQQTGLCISKISLSGNSIKEGSFNNCSFIGLKRTEIINIKSFESLYYSPRGRQKGGRLNAHRPGQPRDAFYGMPVYSFISRGRERREGRPLLIC